MTFQKGQGRIGGSVKGQKYHTSLGYHAVKRWAKRPIEHGLEGDPLARGNTRTLCKCGREFDTDRGLYVHIGRMGKLSSRVQELREKRE